MRDSRRGSCVARVRDLAMALLLLCAPRAGAQPDGGQERTVHLHGAPAAAGGCVAFSAAKVTLSVDRDWGNLEPDALVKVGDPLQVDADATWFEVRSDCTSHETPMNIAWRLTFQPLNGIPRDATGELSPPGSRKPQLTPSAGTYHLRLEAKHPTLNVSAVRELTIVAARENDWVSLGPDGRSPGTSGRVNAFARDPSRPGVAYVAAARGGIWRSDDDAASWYPITDHRGLPPTLATNDVLVLASGRILAATGDAPKDNSPTSSLDDFMRDGVYWSDDQGQTWRRGSGKCRNAARPEGTIARLLRDPLDPDVVFAASLRNGVFRSGNGGTCWVQLADGSVDDIAIVTGNDGHRELWKASLGATSFDQALAVTTNLDTGAPWTSPPAPIIGLPFTPPPFVRARLAASGARVYAALAHDPAKAGDNNVLEAWRYDAGGAWTRLALPANNRCDGQCSYNLALATHPARPDEVLLGTVTAFRSTDAGSSWAEFNSGASIHPDQHALVYDPADPATIFAGNDGGLQRVLLPPGASPSSAAWVFLNRGLAIGQFYDMALAPWSDAATSGALQDAGIQSRIAGRLWQKISGADGGKVAYDAVDPGVLYYTIFNNSIDRGLRLFDGASETVVSPVGKDGSLEIQQDPYRASTIFRRVSTAIQQSNSVAAPVTSQWGCVEAPSNPFDSLSALEAAAPGVVLVGRQLRGVDLVTLPSDIGSTPDCAQPNPAVDIRPLWGGAPQVPVFTTWDPRGGAVKGFAFAAPVHVAPSGPPDPLYVAAARRDSWGVTLLKREVVDVPGPGRPHEKLAGVPIAGDPRGAGSLWAAAGCGGCEGEDLILPGALALDPAAPSRLYVGTMAGLFVGTLDQGTWTWAAEPSVPEARITRLRVRSGSWGTGGIVRLSTFGRGLYERVRFTPASATISPEARARLLSTFGSDSLHSLIVELPPGATTRAGLLSAFPTQGGRRIEGVWASPVRVEKGQRFARVVLVAAGVGAPTSKASDAVTLTLEYGRGRKPFVATPPLAAVWRRGDRAPAEITAVAVDAQLQPLPITVPVTVRERGAVARIQSGSSYSFLAAAPATLTAPATVHTPAGTARIAGWVDGAGRFVAGPTVSMTTNGLGKWEARYVVKARSTAKE